MLTENEMNALKAGRIGEFHSDMAVLSCTDELFVMSGPSGKHTLRIDCTDLSRLNAHWVVFSADSRNKISQKLVVS